MSFFSLQFGDSQKLRLVRILRSTVMVRVGGGWVALDEFLLKNDPCRGKCFFCTIYFFFYLFTPYRRIVSLESMNFWISLISNDFFFYNIEYFHIKFSNFPLNVPYRPCLPLNVTQISRFSVKNKFHCSPDPCPHPKRQLKRVYLFLYRFDTRVGLN